MNQPVAPPRVSPESAAPALRPLTAMVGRGSELGRLLGHLDARRSVRLQAARSMGATALLRALCAEPARPSAPDGTLALPVGLPVADLAVVAARLADVSPTAVGERRMLVLLDDRELGEPELEELQRTFARSVLVVTGHPDGEVDGFTPVVLPGLSQHHAVALVEAAMGRALSLDEGRAARDVASAVDGMPGALVQAAAAVRHGGLAFGDLLDVLDDPPRASALTVALGSGLDDALHVTLSHLRALGGVPATTRLVAAACDVPVEEAARRLRRLSVLGLAFTDGRDGWSAAHGVPAVSEPVRSGVADRVADWLATTGDRLDEFDTAGVLAVVADRVAADDRVTTASVAQVALDRLALDDLQASRSLLATALSWAMPVPEASTLDVGPGTVPDEHAGGHAVADPQRAEEPAEAARPDATPPAAARTPTDVPAEGSADGEAPSPVEASPQPAPQPAPQPSPQPFGETAAESGSGPFAALTGDRRRLAIIAVVAAAVVAAVLLVVPMLRTDPTPQVVRGDVDLGVATVGESTSGTVALDLSSSDASVPVALLLEGPDADAFVLDPARCDTVDCRASVTFTPDRAGTHLATVRAVDAGQREHAVVGLTGSGTGDPAESPASTNLSVTLFPTAPAPLPRDGAGILPVGVRNAGPDDSTGARLTLAVPDGVSAAADGCAFEAAVLTCPLADLPAGGQERVEVRLSTSEGVDQVRVLAEVTPVTDADDAEADNAAGFTYPVAPAEAEAPPEQ